MPTEGSAGIAPGELAQVVESMFMTMLNLEVGAGGTPWFPAGDRMTSAVHLTGDWNGVVLLECTRSQACRFAGRFLSTDPPDAVDGVVCDVLGELDNMIGGNLKCVLPPGIRLSMPSVVDGSDYRLRVCGAAVCEQVAFGCAEGDFWVTVLAARL